ncbi:hypothetical protein IQ07DRAFT_150251 [Pyrenochaeta sp. DS3sAY3a]|nr:hypothetical protein IQ07DRAFT_150251 [Pyrenochaeta sp. DS3sAY3a]
MQFTTIVALLAVAVGINAAPSIEVSKRIPAIPLSIYEGGGCNDPTRPERVTTAWVNTDGSCQGISPIVSGVTTSGRIDTDTLASLPAGCTLIAYFDNECSSVNFIEYTSTGRCGTFGPGKFIHSAKAVGTCA